MDLTKQVEGAFGGRLVVNRELGGGGMSHVFLATDTALSRRVVVKVLPPNLAAGISAERFRREIELAAHLQHPHIMPLIEVAAEGDLLAFSMPYLEGESLRERIKRESGLPVGDAVRLWREILDALSYAHGKGVVHRDIKPENILLSGKHAVVTDFGVARALSEATGGGRMTATGLTIGTPAYMAPEQAAGDPHTDHRADIYSSALVMWELLAGRHPFAGLTPTEMMAAHVTRSMPRVTEVRTSVPAALAELIDRCLAKHPADRPASADAALAALDGIAIAPDVLAGTASAPVSARRRLSRRKLAAIAAAVAGVVAVVAIARPIMRPRTRGTPAIRGIVLIPDEIAPGDSATARAVVQLLANDLQQMPSVVITYANGTLKDYAQRVLGMNPASLARADTMQFLARRLGAHADVMLGIVRVGTGISLTARLVAVRDNGLLGTIKESAADSSQLLAAGTRLATAVRARLADTVRTLNRSTEVTLVSTASLEAVNLIQGADVKFAAGDYLAANKDYRLAMQFDPKFAWGYRQIAVSLSNLDIRHAEMLDAYRRAMDLANTVRPFEQWSIKSLYHSSAGHSDSARTVFDEQLAVTPKSTMALNNLALWHMDNREFAAAEQLLRKAIKPKETPWVAHSNLSRTLLAQGKTAAAESVAANPRLQGTLLGAITIRSLLAAQRRFDELEALLVASAAADTTVNARIDRARFEAALLRTRARVRSADSVSRALEALYVDLGDPGSALREATQRVRVRAEILGDATGARSMLDDALARYPTKSMAVMDRPYDDLAIAAAAAGQAERGAAWIAERAAQVPKVYERADLHSRYEAPKHDRAQADVEMARNASSVALAYARKADIGACAACTAQTIARAFDLAHANDSSLVTWERYLARTDGERLSEDQFSLARALKRVGELYEAKGDTKNALKRYGELIELWKHADPELQPLVNDLKQRVAKLTAKAG